MAPRCVTLVSGGLLAVVLGCAPHSRPAPVPAPAKAESAPLTLSVVYPPLLGTDGSWRAARPLESRDSAFVFGAVGRPQAIVRVNGTPASVAPTGGWIAWLALPDDSVARFTVEAEGEDGIDRARLEFVASLPPRFVPPSEGPWIDPTSLTPVGDGWVRPGEGVRLSVRAAPYATVRALLPDSTVVPFLPESRAPPLTWGERAFGTLAPEPQPADPSRYVAWWVGPLGPAPGPVFQPAAVDPAAPWMLVEAAAGVDTVRLPWPLRVGVVDDRLPAVGIVDDDPAGTGATDGLLPGRPAPWGTYHWFFPNGTRLVVSGRWNDQIRVQLSRRSVAWVDARDLHALPPGTAPPGGTTESIRLHPTPASVTVRVPLPDRVPFRVDEGDRELSLTLYGVAANADWIQYGGADSLVSLVAFHAAAEDETRVTVSLSRAVWGYRTRWSGSDLLLEIRRPPLIDPRRPLRGLTVALDPGHPPLGATGPTGLYEGDVVLAVARRARELFARAGASVVLLRDDTLPRALPDRVGAAEAADAHLLISIHANALPDGVNPFLNNGTSVYYFHPRSAPLARAVNRALVRQFGVRDLGIGRGDLALARPTWMPAILAEGLFLMIPEQEAILGSDAGQWQYARGLVEGALAFLREWAARS